jgi:V-type H+-transporting ATPase subunit a
MKLSMVAAFVHMLFGSVIRIINDIHQKKRATLLLESIPKLILLICTVGYLVFMIVFKWMIDWTGR